MTRSILPYYLKKSLTKTTVVGILPATCDRVRRCSIWGADRQDLLHAAQVVGATGHVTGVDMTPEMLTVAEKYRAQIGERLGFHNVEFRRGRIQDLRTNLHGRAVSAPSSYRFGRGFASLHYLSGPTTRPAAVNHR